MTLRALNAQAGSGGAGLEDLYPAIKELQGLRVSVVAGAAANTKMNIAAMRDEDTVVAVIASTDAGGALADDTANVTVQDTKATGTLTISGNPVDAETFAVNGTTFTFKTTPIAATHVKITAGDNTAMAAAVAAAVNANENRRDSGNWRQPDLVATSALGVVTFTATADGTAGNSIALAESATNVAKSGTTLANGSATGGIKSTTNNTGKSLIVIWFDKNQ